MNTQQQNLLTIALMTSLLGISQLSSADQAERKACVTPLATHGENLKRQGNLNNNDIANIDELAAGGLLNYKLLQKKSFTLIGTDYSNNVLTPVVMDSFTGKDIGDCNSNNCGLPKITPIPGTPDFDKQLMIKNAIEASQAMSQPVVINQSITRPNGRVETVPVQYTVIVQAVHPGSVCYTYYTAGKMRQFCYG